MFLKTLENDEFQFISEVRCSYSKYVVFFQIQSLANLWDNTPLKATSGHDLEIFRKKVRNTQKQAKNDLYEFVTKFGEIPQASGNFWILCRFNLSNDEIQANFERIRFDDIDFSTLFR